MTDDTLCSAETADDCETLIPDDSPDLDENETLIVTVDGVKHIDGVERVDAALARLTGISRSLIQKYIDGGRVTRGTDPAAKPVAKKDKTAPGEVYCIHLPPLAVTDVVPEDMPLSIVYEDDAILVLDKPAGVVVHPAPGHTSGTLVNGLLYHCGDSLSGIGGVLRPGIVHRIDRDTTGLLCVAKTDEAHKSLSAQLATHHMHREYRMILCGTVDAPGTIDKPLGRHPMDRKKMAVYPPGTGNPGGKPGVRDAVTHYTPLENFPGDAANGSFTYAQAVLETGRTHQIRVHMASIGHPVLGDPIYGGDTCPFAKKHRDLLPGQLLHAAVLHLTHPVTGREMQFSAPLPQNFEEVLRILRQR